MWLQRLTTRDPEDDQLEVALASIKAVLHEEKYNLKEANQKVMTLEEVEVEGLQDLENSNFKLNDFLEV